MLTRPLNFILSLTLLLSLCSLAAFASPARPGGDGPAFDGTNNRQRKARRTRRHRPRRKRAGAIRSEPKLEQVTLPPTPSTESPTNIGDDNEGDEEPVQPKTAPDIKPPMGKPSDIKPPMGKPE